MWKFCERHPCVLVHTSTVVIYSMKFENEHIPNHYLKRNKNILLIFLQSAARIWICWLCTQDTHVSKYWDKQQLYLFNLSSKFEQILPGSYLVSFISFWFGATWAHFSSSWASGRYCYPIWKLFVVKINLYFYYFHFLFSDGASNSGPPVSPIRVGKGKKLINIHLEII